MARRGSNHRRRRRRSSGLNLLIAVDKPFGQVTRSVDNYVGKVLEDDGIGHVGTLDPNVTGVLVLGVGQAKKLIPSLEEDRRKSYSARIAFGTQTSTDDAGGSVVRTAPNTRELMDEAYAKDVLASFVGRQMQRPPIYSAIKVNGVRSYDRARAGEVFELPEREIEVFEATLTGIDTSDGVVWDCDFVVSPGTYIRALARDLGVAVKGAAHLKALCRTKAGNVDLADCVSLDLVGELGAARIAEVALDPVRALGIDAYELDENELRFVQNGRPLEADPSRLPKTSERIAMVHDGLLFGVWTYEQGMLRALANCPAGVSGIKP